MVIPLPGNSGSATERPGGESAVAPGAAPGRGNGSGAAGVRSRERHRPPTAARRPPTAAPRQTREGAARRDAGSTGHGTPTTAPQVFPVSSPPAGPPAGMPGNAEPGRPWPHSPKIPRPHSLPSPVRIPRHPPPAFHKLTVHHALIKKSGAFLPAHRTCYKGSPGGSTWDAARRSASGPGLRAPPPRRGDRPRPTRKPLGVAPRLPVRHIRVTGDSKSLASIAECSPLCRTSRTRGSVSRRHLLTRLDAPERGRIRP